MCSSDVACTLIDPTQNWFCDKGLVYKSNVPNKTYTCDLDPDLEGTNNKILLRMARQEIHVIARTYHCENWFFNLTEQSMQHSSRAGHGTLRYDFESCNLSLDDLTI